MNPFYVMKATASETQPCACLLGIMTPLRDTLAAWSPLASAAFSKPPWGRAGSHISVLQKGKPGAREVKCLPKIIQLVSHELSSAFLIPALEFSCSSEFLLFTFPRGLIPGVFWGPCPWHRVRPGAHLEVHCGESWERIFDLESPQLSMTPRKRE